MLCPACNGKLEVVETVKDLDFVYRRRRCKSCGQLIYTTEKEVSPNPEFRAVWNTYARDKRNQFKEDKNND